MLLRDNPSVAACFSSVSAPASMSACLISLILSDCRARVAASIDAGDRVFVCELREPLRTLAIFVFSMLHLRDQLRSLAKRKCCSLSLVASAKISPQTLVGYRARSGVVGYRARSEVCVNAHFSKDREANCAPQ